VLPKRALITELCVLTGSRQGNCSAIRLSATKKVYVTV